MLAEAAESEEPHKIYNVSLRDSSDPNDQDDFADNLELIEDFVKETAEAWLEADVRVKELPARDPAIVPDTTKDLLAAINNSEASPVKESVERGRQLFQNDKGSCYKCHGREGKGDGQTNDYDDWAKDWAKDIGLDKPERHVPFIARGALPIRKVSPRNFQEGVFRGGDSPESLFRRISLGIEGTPMPAAPVAPEEIWDLVNYVRSLKVEQADDLPKKVD